MLLFSSAIRVEFSDTTEKIKKKWLPYTSQKKKSAFEMQLYTRDDNAITETARDCVIRLT